MGRESIWKRIFQFSGPTIISMLVTSSYNLVDAIFVGRLGPAAVAAMAVAHPLIMITMSVAMGTGIGAASLIGRNLGAGKAEEANRIAGVAITTSVLISASLTAIILTNLDRVLRLFGASGAVMAPARTYVSIVIAFTTLSKLAIVLSAIVRAEGNPMLSSGTQIASSIFNIITDPIFILGWGPIPAFGMAGAAGTTVAAWILAVVIYVVYFISGKSSFRFKPSYFVPDLRIVREIYRVGAASIVRGAAGSTVSAVGNQIAASFGVITLAVKGVLIRASSFAFMPAVGIGSGVLPLVAYNFGAQQKGRMGEIVIKSSLFGLIWGSLCFIFVMLFPTQLMSVFNDDPQFLATGTTAIRIFSLGFFTVGVQMILSHYFQGIGEGLASLVLASARQIIFLLPAYFILSRIFGVLGIWLSFAVADFFSIVITLVLASVSFKKHGITLTWHAQPEALPTPASATHK